jgi:hypothetical protein
VGDKTLLGHLRDAVAASPGWKEDHQRRLIEAFSDDDDIRNDAYWWCIIHGVLRFRAIDHWFDDDGNDWKKSVKYSRIAARGVALLESLRTADR